MSNANEPAMPTFTHDVKADLPLHKTESKGLTKREMIAMHALQGILACYGTKLGEVFVAEIAVKYTDSLLTELKK